MGAGAATFNGEKRHRFDHRRQNHSPEPTNTSASLNLHYSGAQSSAHSTSPSPPGDAPLPWVVWLSLDPRKSQLDLYPFDIAWKLEAALKRKDKSVDLGTSFYDAVVHLLVIHGGRYQMQQVTKSGNRDVMRVSFNDRDADMKISLRVVRTESHGWRFAASKHTVNSEGRSVVVPRHMFVPISLDPTEILPAPECSTEETSIPKDEAKEEACSTEDVDGMEPLWEWCRWDGIAVDMLGALPEDAWGMYSKEQNEAIELAHASSKPSIEIEVGIRKYLLSFGPRRNLARQEDPFLRKRRLVRRRLVPTGIHEKLLKSMTVTATELDGQDECAICCGEFADTATMPVVILPDCKHIFHTACVQHEADDKKPCPVCRATVDWKAIL